MLPLPRGNPGNKPHVPQPPARIRATNEVMELVLSDELYGFVRRFFRPTIPAHWDDRPNSGKCKTTTNMNECTPIFFFSHLTRGRPIFNAWYVSTTALYCITRREGLSPRVYRRCLRTKPQRSTPYSDLDVAVKVHQNYMCEIRNIH